MQYFDISLQLGYSYSFQPNPRCWLYPWKWWLYPWKWWRPQRGPPHEWHYTCTGTFTLAAWGMSSVMTSGGVGKMGGWVDGGGSVEGGSSTSGMSWTASSAPITGRPSMRGAALHQSCQNMNYINTSSHLEVNTLATKSPTLKLKLLPFSPVANGVIQIHFGHGLSVYIARKKWQLLLL